MPTCCSLMNRRGGGKPFGEAPGVAGTLSILDDPEQAGLVNFDDAVAELRKTSFRVSQTVLAEIKAKRSR